MKTRALNLKVAGAVVTLDIPEILYIGLWRTKKLLLALVRYFFIQARPSNLEKRRELLSNQLANLLDFTVHYGPFKGLELSREFNWSKSDIAPMLLGTYEQHLLEHIVESLSDFRNFIDLGAGDGYYVAGLLYSGLADSVVAYEMNESSRATILKNMEINGLSSGFEIRGTASPDFLDDFSTLELSNSLILIDVEGYEFELFEKIDMSRLKNTQIVIEIHDFEPDSEAKVTNLLSHLGRTHSLSIITTGSRNLDLYSELADFNDSDRWLLVSEGRPKSMRWVSCMPM
jgi:precorrin-6B methylase 2